MPVSSSSGSRSLSSATEDVPERGDSPEGARATLGCWARGASAMPVLVLVPEPEPIAVTVRVAGVDVGEAAALLLAEGRVPAREQSFFFNCNLYALSFSLSWREDDGRWTMSDSVTRRGGRLTLHHSGRRVPQPRHSMFNLTQAWQDPESFCISSHRFLLILHVQHPAFERGGTAVDDVPATAESV